jgi:hypothetical protein
MCLFYRFISLGFFLVWNVNTFFMRICFFFICRGKGYVFILLCTDAVCVLFACRYATVHYPCFCSWKYNAFPLIHKCVILSYILKFGIN